MNLGRIGSKGVDGRNDRKIVLKLLEMIACGGESLVERVK